MVFVLSLVILLCATSCALKETGSNQHGSMSGGQRLPVSSGNAEGGRLYVDADQCHCNPPEYVFLDECRSMKMEETLFYQNLTRIQGHYQCSLRQGEKSPDFPSRMEKHCIRSIFVQDGYGTMFIDNSDDAKKKNRGKSIVYEKGLKQWMITDEVIENADFQQLMYRNRVLALTTIAVIELESRLDIWLIPHEAPSLHRIFSVRKDHLPLSCAFQKPIAPTITAEKILGVCSSIVEHEKQVLPDEKWGFWIFKEILLLSNSEDVSNLASRDEVIRENIGNAIDSLPCLYLSAGVSHTLSQHHTPRRGWVGASFHYLYDLKNEKMSFVKRFK